MEKHRDLNLNTMQASTAVPSMGHCRGAIVHRLSNSLGTNLAGRISFEVQISNSDRNRNVGTYGCILDFILYLHSQFLVRPIQPALLIWLSRRRARSPQRKLCRGDEESRE